MRFKGALVGFGFIAENGHLPAYEAGGDFEIVAVADECAARRKVASARIRGCRVYGTFDELLASEGDRIDFVDVATPPYAHAAIARKALQAKKHVLCEKPLTTTARDAEELLRLADKNQRVLMPGHCYKHAPVVRAIRRALDDGHIGRVHYVTLDTFRTTHALGVPEWNRDWRREERFSGGGIAMDHGSHTLYLAFEWLDGYPTAISAKMSRSRPEPEGYDTEDTFSAAISFPAGQCAANLTWRAGVRKVIYTLHGEKGAIRVEDDEIEIAVKGEKPRRATAASHWMDASHTAWFGELFRRFSAAIESGTYVTKDALDAAACVEVIENAYASARDGSRERPLRIAPSS